MFADEELAKFTEEALPLEEIGIDEDEDKKYLPGLVKVRLNYFLKEYSYISMQNFFWKYQSFNILSSYLQYCLIDPMQKWRRF